MSELWKKSNSKLNWFTKAALTLICTTAGNAFAAPYNAGGIMVEADPSWVTGQVLADALKLTSQLQRPVLTYHWVPRNLVQVGNARFPLTGSVSNQDPGIRALVEENMKGRISRFWDTSLAISGRAETGGAMAPNGLYVAMEPVISRSYGGASWLMYQVEFKVGTRFLDGRYDHPVVGSALGQALRARGCNVGFARELIKSDTGNVPCRKALNDIVAATNTGLIAYIFRAEPFQQDCTPPGWSKGWSTAFVLIRPDSISRLTYLTADAPTQNDGLMETRQLINGVFQRVNQAGVFTGVVAAPEPAVKNFINENYFSCNSRFKEW